MCTISICCRAMVGGDSYVFNTSLTRPSCKPLMYIFASVVTLAVGVATAVVPEPLIR